MKKLFLILLIGVLLINLSSAFNWTNGIVSYWKLNENSGPVLDAVERNNGTNNGATTGVSGKINTAYDFTTSESDYINVTQTGLNLTSNLTLQAWIKPESTGTYNIIGKDSGGAGGAQYDLILIGGVIYCSTGESGGGTLINGSQLTLGAWSHIICTAGSAGGPLRLYVNGINVANGTRGADLTTLNFFIGKRNNGVYFDGVIDEVGVWNRTLSYLEVQELWNGGNGQGYNDNTLSNIDVRLISPDNRSTLSDVGEIFSTNFNITSGSGNYSWKNATYYVWNSNGSLFNSTSILLSGNTTNYSLFIDNFVLNNYNWNVYGCYGNVTFSNCTWSSNGNFTFDIIPFNIISENYNNATIAGSTETFTANFSFLSGYRLSKIKFIYNGTEYDSTFSEYSADNYYTSKSVIIPNVSATTNTSFYWSITLESGFIQNSTLHNQSIYVIAIDDCSVYVNQIINISLHDEDTQDFLAGAIENTSVKLEIILSSLDKSNNIINYSKNYDKINPARLCFQNPLLTSKYRLDGVIEYSSSGRFTEYYHFQNYTLQNSTSNIKISLYNLNSTKGQEFKVTYKDSNFVPVRGAILDIQRKYTDEGLFKTTERPKTGTEGYTVAHLIRNDVIYNIVVQREGQVVATFENIVAECQNPLLKSCEINLNSYGSSSLPSDFRTLNDISFSWNNFNRTEREISVIYSIISGATESVSLNVTLFDRLGNISVCSDLLIASGGTLSCTIPSSFGNSTVVAALYKNGEFVGQAMISLTQSPTDIYGSSIIVVAMILFLAIAGYGASSDSPMIMGGALILGSLILIALNLVYSPSIVGFGATVLWFIISVILILIKGSNRQ